MYIDNPQGRKPPFIVYFLIIDSKGFVNMDGPWHESDNTCGRKTVKDATHDNMGKTSTPLTSSSFNVTDGI